MSATSRKHKGSSGPRKGTAQRLAGRGGKGVRKNIEQNEDKSGEGLVGQKRGGGPDNATEIMQPKTA